MAGEYVEGCAYIGADKDYQFDNLNLILSGSEYVRWTEGSNDEAKAHSNRNENYREVFPLSDFKGTLPVGQYAFPFSILLPQMMSGSLYKSETCYISYALTLELTKANDQKSK